MTEALMAAIAKNWPSGLHRGCDVGQSRSPLMFTYFQSH
eukprot:CAMPEP_0171632726 /NCGR_PEP_ID=MMETSP0990-20121206/24660_1 /TAXON_ID=483369 /ORGANISM="non described non described, Strain CCMP2098" /LENGTH=38 /DNA_ID= /DNA_START= /DNA_END= /DNA_ORIENTATION=